MKKIFLILLSALSFVSFAYSQPAIRLIEKGVDCYVIKPDGDDFPAKTYSDGSYVDCTKMPRVRVKLAPGYKMNKQKPCQCPSSGFEGFKLITEITYPEMENLIRTTNVSEINAIGDTIYIGHGQDQKQLIAPAGGFLNAYVANYIKSYPVYINTNTYNNTGTAVAATGAAPYTAIQFEFDSSVLRTSSYPVLDATSADLRSTGKTVWINGYASAKEGTAAHALRLSRDRANSVKTYLVNSGVDAKHLKIKGYGETHPVADNATEDGRVMNRRVEFKH